MAPTPKSKRRRVVDDDVPPSPGTPTKKTQKRDQYSQEKLVKLLKLQDVKALKDWLGSPIFEKRWNAFVQHGLPKKGKSKKGWEMTSVHSRIVDGERHGRRRFSDRDSSPSTFNDYLDCSAWLLYVLTTENTDSSYGVFFGRNLPEMERYQRMWRVIGFKIWSLSPSRQPKSHRRTPSGASIAEEEIIPQPVSQLDTTKGVLRVDWKNIPEDVEESGEVRTPLVVRQVRSYDSLEELYNALRAAFMLRDINHQVTAFSLDEYDFETWDDLRQYVHDAEGCVNAGLYTQEVDNLQMQPMPEAILAVPTGEQSDDLQSRQLHWNEMTSEIVQYEATKMDVKYRYWRYILFRTVASGRDDLALDRLELKLQSENVADNNAEHEEALGIEYMLTMEDLQKAVYGKQQQDTEEDIEDEDENVNANCPPPTKLREITQEEKELYRRQVQWLQNSEYERDNHDEACRILNIRNPERPHIEGMFLSAELRHYQPTGIAALSEFETSEVGGGVLADEVGTGKTFVATGHILHRDNQRNDRTSLGLEVSAPRPTVLLVPKSLIHSWKRKIQSFTDRFKIIIYYGPTRKRGEEAVEYVGQLTKSSPVFDKTNEENARTVIISTVATWAARHGPRKQREWKINECMREAGMKKSEATKFVDGRQEHYELLQECVYNLKGLIERLIIDEGHELRLQPADFGAAIDWIGADYRLIISATPTRKGIHEFVGIMHYIQNPALHQRTYLQSLGFRPDELAGDDPLEAALAICDPFTLSDTDPRAALRYCDAALKLHIFNGQDEAEVGVRMRTVLRKVMLKRSYASTVNGKRVDQDLPAVQRTTIGCSFTPDEEKLYNAIYFEATARLCRLSDTDGVCWNPSAYRQLCLVTSWISFQWLAYYKVKEMKDFRSKGKTAINILEDVRRGQKEHGIANELLLPIPDSDDVQEIMTVLADGAPKLRMLLHLLSDIVVLEKEKVIVWVQFPAQMEWIRCVFEVAGLEARCLWPDLNLVAREELVNDFHSKPEGFKILVASFMVSPSGLDLHGHCRTVIEYDQAPDEATRIQMVGRVQRDGQRKWIRHIILVTEGSFDERRVAVAMLQNLPGLLTQLNLDVWGGGIDEDGEVPLGEWSLYNGELVSADEPSYEALGLEPLQPKELLLIIQQSLSGQEVGKAMELVEDAAFGEAANNRLWKS